jgi:hypothetical protein
VDQIDTAQRHRFEARAPGRQDHRCPPAARLGSSWIPTITVTAIPISGSELPMKP